MRVGYHAISATGVKWQRVGWQAIFVWCDPTVISPGLTRTQPSRCSRTNYLKTACVTLRTQSVSVVTMEYTRQCLLHREVWDPHTGADYKFPTTFRSAGRNIVTGVSEKSTAVIFRAKHFRRRIAPENRKGRMGYQHEMNLYRRYWVC